jgi:hypothetical protein
MTGTPWVFVTIISRKRRGPEMRTPKILRAGDDVMRLVLI